MRHTPVSIHGFISAQELSSVVIPKLKRNTRRCVAMSSSIIQEKITSVPFLNQSYVSARRRISTNHALRSPASMRARDHVACLKLGFDSCTQSLSGVCLFMQSEVDQTRTHCSSLGRPPCPEQILREYHARLVHHCCCSCRCEVFKIKWYFKPRVVASGTR